MTYASASDLAGLPGMPGTKRGVQVRAQAEGWAFIEQLTRGGTQRLYETGRLPPATRAALQLGHGGRGGQGHLPFKRGTGAAAPAQAGQAGQVAARKLQLEQDMGERAAQAQRLEALRGSHGLPPARQQAMDAKLFILKAWEIHAGERGASKQAQHAFACAYNSGSIQVEAWVREAVPQASGRSLERWAKLLRRHGITALAGAYGNRRGATLIDLQGPLREFAEGMLVQYPHARATHVMQGMVARFAGTDLDLPSIRTLERWVAQWRLQHAETVTALANPDAWKNRYMAAFGSQSEGIERLNQRWELDSTPGDVMLTDGRHTVLGVVDVHPRRAKLLVSKSSKATAVAALVRGALLDWGVPEVAKTDNGSDYTSRHMVRVFGSLDVDHQLCPPFQPWHKPHIERFFGTFSRALVELLPGFIGHNVAERSAIEARKSFADRLMTRGEVVEIRMSSVEFQSFCDRWVGDIYHHNPHEGLDGATPYQVAAAWRAPVRRIGDERALDVLLAEAPGAGGMRVVQKKGIAVDDAWFIAPELEAYIGQRVRVLYDELHHDLGRLYVFGGPDLQFVCVAECPERTGMDRREVAARAKELQKARVQNERAALRAAAKRAGTDEIVDEILRSRAAAAGKLATLPAPTVAYASAGLAAAGEAAAAAAAATRGPASSAEVLRLDGVAQAWDRIKAQAAADEAGIPRGMPNELDRRRLEKSDGLRDAPNFDDRQQRVQWLLRQAHVRELAGEERDYLAGYRREQPASFFRMQEMAAELFGPAQPNNPDCAAR